MFEGVPLPDLVSYGNDGDAMLAISGPMSPEGPSFVDRLFGYGGTAYSDIIEAANSLRGNESVKRVKLVMHTPGGTVDGMHGAQDALKKLAAEKDVVAENHGMIASAGYGLAVAADRIIAMTPFAKTGSIGVVGGGIDASGAMEKFGVKRVVIVSKNAPNKAPNLATEEGQAVLQKEVDATERVFIQSIADGRGVTPEYVIENYGKGALLIAQDPDPDTPDALSAGLIDGLSFGASAVGDGGQMAAGPTKFQDFPMVDRPWDGNAAEMRVRKLVGATAAPNSRYRQAFFWYDTGNAENFGAYKLPFVDVVDGKLVANINGVRAADGAMSGARGRRVQIPDSDRKAVQAHIDRYRQKWDRTQGGGNAQHTQFEEEAFVLKDLEQLKAEFPQVYEQAVAVGADAARTEAAKTTKTIVAMAYEHNVGKETAMKMAECASLGDAAIVAMNSKPSEGAAAHGDTDEPNPANAAATTAEDNGEALLAYAEAHKGMIK
jgi:ClpP class serine protease